MTDTAVAGTQSALDMMTGAIMARKDAAGAKLTPVGTERRPEALPFTQAAFPNDHPAEAIEQRIIILDSLFTRLAELDEQTTALWGVIHVQYAAMREALEAAKAALAMPPEAAPAAAQTAQKAREATGDAKARAKAASVAATTDEGLEAALAASISAVNEAPTVDAAVDEVARFNREFAAKSAAAQASVFKPAVPENGTGWACTEHGQSTTKKSRLGRSYQACPVAGCAQFEKLA